MALTAAALSYAVVGDTAARQRRLADAYTLLEDADSPPPPWAGESRVAHAGTIAAEGA